MLKSGTLRSPHSSAPSAFESTTARDALLFQTDRGGDAQRVGRVDTEDLYFARKKSEFLERQRQRPVVGMSLDIGVELRRRKRAADHIAFEFGHVDAIGRKPAHRLVERRRHVAHPKQKGGYGRRPARRSQRLA